VRKHHVVGVLEAPAPGTGDDEHHHGQHEHADAGGIGDLVKAQVQQGGQDVVAAGSPQHPVEGDACGQERGTGGRIARSLQQVVFGLVAADPGLEEGPAQEDHHQHHRHHLRRDHDAPGDRVSNTVLSQPGMIRKAPSVKPRYQSG